jgi:biotin carboxyl carrier protein
MRRFRFIYRGTEGPEELLLDLEGSRCGFSRAGRSESATVARLADGRLSLLFDDGRQICGRVAMVSDGEVEVVTGSSRLRLALSDPLRDRIAHAGEEGAGARADEEIRALIPGRIVEVHASEGQSVAAGELILVLEAMKMQNEIRCASAGTVLRVGVERGKAVEGGALLAVVRSKKV